jgi:hypothetical protein
MSQKRPNSTLQELWLQEIEDAADSTKFRYIIKARYKVTDPYARALRTLGCSDGYRGIRAAQQRARKIARKAGLAQTEFPILVGAHKVAFLNIASGAVHLAA